eukprot:1518592-Pleurochrysis_carterae.AAC.1
MKVAGLTDGSSSSSGSFLKSRRSGACGVRATNAEERLAQQRRSLRGGRHLDQCKGVQRPVPWRRLLLGCSVHSGCSVSDAVLRPFSLARSGQRAITRPR